MKVFFHIILAAILTSCVIGCGQSEEERQRLSRAERDSLRRIDSAALKIGVLPTEDCLPIVVAEQLRLYDTLGVSVHLRRYHAMSECRYALANNLVEGAVIDTMLMGTLNKEAPWLYAAMHTPMKWQFLAAKKSRIARWSQMGDKMIAADSHGLSHVLAEQVNDTLRKQKKQAFVIQVEDLKVRTEMLITGNVDAALLPEPFAAQARKKGANVIDMSPVGNNAGVVAMRTKVMNDKERKRQQQLFLKAIDIANDSIRRYGKNNYIGMLQW